MKYKVGDKVRVRKDLVPGNKYGDVIYVSNMDKFKNEECVITSTDNEAYCINGLGYWWTEEMLEPVDDLLDYALEKLGMTKEELKDERDANKEDIVFIKRYMKDKEERIKYCQKFNSACNGCEVKKFKDKYKTYGNFDCNDVYKYLKEKGEI